MKFDLHVHTTLSACSRLSIVDILRHARAAGLDGVCITDHQSMDIRHHLKEGVQADGLCVIFGMEYTTADGDFLVFGPFEDISQSLSAPQLLDAVRREGGAAIAAHPFRNGRAVEDYIVRQGLCHIAEACNGRNSDAENQSIDRWQKRYDLTVTGGSDAHTLEELGRIVTRFEVPVQSRGDLICALNNRLCAPAVNRRDDFAPHNATTA